MSALALTFIVLPFVLFGGFYFIALLNYELTPRIAALPLHQRMALVIWGGYSLIVGLDVVSTHYGIPGGVAAFCLTFFGVPLLFIATGYATRLVYQGAASVREVLAADSDMGVFLAWVTLPVGGTILLGLFGSAVPGDVAKMTWIVGVGAFFAVLWAGWALYAVAKGLDCISATGDAFKVPGWWDRALALCGLVRASEYAIQVRAEEIAYRNECAAEDALKEVRSTWFSPLAFELQAKAHQRQAILAADLSATVRDLQAERLNRIDEIEALELENDSLHEDLDAEGRRLAEALTQVDVLRGQLEATDAGLFALYAKDLAPEVERSERISEALKDLDTVWGSVRYAATPAEVHRFARAVQALEG